MAPHMSHKLNMSNKTHPIKLGHQSKYKRKATVDREMMKLRPHLRDFVQFCIQNDISKTSTLSYIRNEVASIGPAEWHSQIRMKDPNHTGHGSFMRYNYLKDNCKDILLRLSAKVEKQREGIEPDPATGCVLYRGAHRPQVNIDKTDLESLNKGHQEHYSGENQFTGKLASARVIALSSCQQKIQDNGWQASHICHRGYCIAPHHVVMESLEDHGKRSVCVQNKECKCGNATKCIFPNDSNST